MWPSFAMSVAYVYVHVQLLPMLYLLSWIIQITNIHIANMIKEIVNAWYSTQMVLEVICTCLIFSLSLEHSKSICCVRLTYKCPWWPDDWTIELHYSVAYTNGLYSLIGILKTPYRACLDILNCFLLLVRRCSTRRRVRSTSSKACPLRSNIWHLLNYCLFFKALILYTTLSNSIAHARGSWRCFHWIMPIEAVLNYLFVNCYTWLQVYVRVSVFLAVL